MKSFILSIFLISTFAMGTGYSKASQPPKVIQIQGKLAETMMHLMLSKQETQFLENTVCLTQVEYQGVVCSLFGSHGSCGAEPEYNCSTVE